MAEQTEIDVPGTRGVADRVEAATASFASALSALRATLGEHDRCWSDDEFGKTFAESYVDTAMQATDEAQAGVETGHTLASDLRSTAAAFTDQDDDNAASVTAAGNPSIAQDAR